MTFEHKIVVGLNDIKAISLECNKCQTRITLAPDGIEVPLQCPKCGKIWITGDPNAYQKIVASPYVNFFTALATIRTLLENGATFKILFEFEYQ